MQLPACDLAQVGDVTVMRDTAASIDVPDVFVPLMRAAMEEAVARDLEAVIFGYSASTRSGLFLRQEGGKGALYVAVEGMSPEIAAAVLETDELEEPVDLAPLRPAGFEVAWPYLAAVGISPPSTTRDG
jgi:hypothetical protein